MIKCYKLIKVYDAANGVQLSLIDQSMFDVGNCLQLKTWPDQGQSLEELFITITHTFIERSFKWLNRIEQRANIIKQLQTVFCEHIIRRWDDLY